MYWHVHWEHPPWCDIRGKRTPTATQAELTYWKNRGGILVSSDYDGPSCPYLELMNWRANTMSAPTKIMLTDGTEANADEMTCEGCGEPLSTHGCGTSGTSTPTVTISPIISRSGKGTVRKKPEEKPACPHCGAPMHFNYGATAVNAACLTMQYAVDKGIITDPQHQRAPVLTVEMMGEIAAWAGSLAVKPTYGDMVSAAGGAGTYAALRPKTGRKKKAVAAPEGQRIEDMASNVETPAAAEKPKRNKKTQAVEPMPEETAAVEAAEEIVKPKRSKKTERVDVVIDTTVEEPTANGHTVQEAPVEVSPVDEKAARRAAREERRKKLLGNLS